MQAVACRSPYRQGVRVLMQCHSPARTLRGATVVCGTGKRTCLIFMTAVVVKKSCVVPRHLNPYQQLGALPCLLALKCHQCVSGEV